MIVNIFSNNKHKDWVKCIDSWKKSPFEIIIWDDLKLEEFIEKTEFYNKYKSLSKRIYQIDFLKYVMLYENGDLFSDADVMYIKDFSHLLSLNKLNIVESFVKHISEVEPFLMYSPKKNKKLLEIINNCDNREDAFSSCGGKIITLDDNINILKRQYFNNMNNINSYTKHLNTYTWRED